MNVKAIEHFSGLLYGNNLENTVNHVLCGREGLNVSDPVHF